MLFGYAQAVNLMTKYRMSIFDRQKSSKLNMNLSSWIFFTLNKIVTCTFLPRAEHFWEMKNGHYKRRFNEKICLY